MYISENDVKNNLTMDEIIVVVEEAQKDYSEKKIEIPGRVTINVRGKENSAIILAANHLSKSFYGFKQASSFSDNAKKGLNTVISDIHLYSGETGEHRAAIAATLLTALKTGAASAVATKHMAKPKAGILAIIGVGIQAQTQLEAIQHVMKLTEVRVYDLSHENIDKFIEFAETIKNRDYLISASKTSDSCVYGADVIVTATTAMKPVFDSQNVSLGTHINAIGSFTPDMQEIDSKIVVRADKIVTDNMDETWDVAGDLLVPFNNGEITKSRIHGNVGDIITGKITGRETHKEITIYESVGFAALDIALAIKVYEKIKNGFLRK